MSRNPGIGKPWIEKWKMDVYPHDYVIVNGRKMKPPKYYDNLFEKLCSWSELSDILEIRKERALEHADNNTDERLAVREEIQQLKQKQLRRET